MSRHVLHRWLPAVLALACCLVTAAEAKDRTTELHACSGATDVTWQGPRLAALDDGRALLVFDGTPALLSADRRSLRTIDWPAQAGPVREIAALPGRGVLIATGHGLWLLDQAARLRALTDCRDTGTIFTNNRGARGQVLLRTQNGVFELTPAGALRLLTPRRVDGLLAMTDGRWLADAGGALHGLNDSGTLVPLLTGAKAALSGGERSGWHLDDSDAASDGVRLGRGWLIVPNRADAPLFVHDDGPVERLRGPAGGPLRETAFLMPLRDGRVFALLASGLYRLLPGPLWRPVSTAVRLTCADSWHANGSGMLSPRSEVPGRALFSIGQQVFEIAQNDEAVLLHGQRTCGQALGFSAATGADGRVYLAIDGAAYRIGPTRVLEPLSLPAGARAVNDYGVRSPGFGRVIVATEGMSYEVGPGGHLRPIGDVAWPFAMRGGRMVGCGDKASGLKQAVDGMRFEPVAEAAGRACVRVDAARDGSALVVFGSAEPYLRIDAAGRLMPLPQRRIELPDGDLFVGREPRALFIGSDGSTKEIDVPAGWARTEQRLSADLQFARPLHFLDERRGFGFLDIFAGGGVAPALAASDDGGTTWRAVRSGGEPIEGAEAVTFADDGRTGMAVGSAGRVWGTQDGGRSWQRLPDAEPVGLRAVWMPGPAGRAYGQTGSADFLRTDDGGMTWSPLPAPRHAVDAADVDPTVRLSFSEQGRRLWWSTGDGHVLSSTDDGRTWALHWRHAFAARSVVRGDASIAPRRTGLVQFEGPAARACLAWVAGLLCSDPDSLTLRLRTFPEQALQEIARAADGLHGWAVGADGLILATADGGATWTPQHSGVEELLLHVFFLPDGQHGWASGPGVLLATRDGGQTWARVLPRLAE